MPTLHFKGKTFVQNHHLAVKYHQLVPKKDLSLTDKVSRHDNLIIQGDNLKALKVLLPTYSGKVKCIYIDPPYNTGNEGWIYNDNVNSPMIKDWLGKVVDKEDMTRHDKWLCMMMPRLKLLRELLSEDGAIFISIDDNEQHNLRCLLDEVFGEQNFVSEIVWKGKGGGADNKYVMQTHEYITIYAKNKEFFIIGEEIKYDEVFPKFDSRKKRNYKTQLARKWGSNSRKTDRPNLFYPIIAPDGKKVFPILPNTEDGCWRWSQEKMKKEIEEDNIEFIKEKNVWIVYEKIYEPLEGEVNTKKFSTWFDNVGSTATGTKELFEIFQGKKFDYPKPTSLIKKLIQISNTSDYDIILDSFAGSGTTAHAVLELNKEDGGNRKFILVEQEDYANTITAERVRRVIKGVKTVKNEKLKKGTGGSFSYFELGKEIEMESILRGKNLPSFKEFARYLFFTATGEEFNEKSINEKTGFIGESRNFKVYLRYKPNIEWLKKNALTLDEIKSLPKFNREKDKMRLVFAPAKYVDDETLKKFGIDFSQLPYEIYRMQK